MPELNPPMNYENNQTTYAQEYIEVRNVRNFRCQELLVKIIRNNGVKIRNCLETNGQFLRENAFINIERKYELQLFCIIDGANECQESLKNS